MRAGVDWSAVAARECFDGACGEDLPGPFAELGRRARGEVRYPERDLWAAVREDAAWPGASSTGACGGSCGCAGCGDGAAEVDDFWAPVVEGARSASKPEPRASASRSVGRGLAKGRGVSRPSLPLLGRRAGAPSHGKTSPVPEDSSLDTTVDAEADTPTSWCYDADGHRVDCCSWFCDSGPCLEVGSEDCSPRVSSTLSYLEPPDDWTNTCEWKGSGSECGPVLLREQSSSDFWGLDIDTVESYVSITGELEDPVTGELLSDAIDDDEYDLIRYAWALLYANTDLVTWGTCYVTGRSSSGDCILRGIRGFGRNITIYVQHGGDFVMRAQALLHRVTVNRDSDAWQACQKLWDVGTSEERMCGAIAAAAMFAHEISHLCLRSIGDANPEDEECFTAYSIQAAVHYALTRRYVDSQMHSCCGEYASESFGQGAVTTMPLFGCYDDIP